MKIITITIGATGAGEATIKPTGYVGASCAKATAEIEAAMGKTVSSVPTAEMRQTTSTLKVGQ